MLDDIKNTPIETPTSAKSTPAQKEAADAMSTPSATITAGLDKINDGHKTIYNAGKLGAIYPYPNTTIIDGANDLGANIKNSKEVATGNRLTVSDNTVAEKGAKGDTDQPELKEIDKKIYQVVKDPDFLDIPLSRKNVKVTDIGQNSFRFDGKLDRAACQPQSDGGVLKAEPNIAATVKISIGADGQAEKIEFTNFKNIKGDGTVLGVPVKDTQVTDARFIKDKNAITGTYDLALRFGGKGWKIDKDQLPSVESFHELAGQLALRMKENGLLNDGRHPELRRLADHAEEAELASSQRVSPNKAVGS